MKPLISIIIPIYKVEEFLHQCVDSIIKQTHRNIEIILVNDGSPDKCGSICDEYAALDSRIKVIHQENGGLSDARNAGLNVCIGDYISFIDSDDLVHPTFIEILYKNLLEGKADISFCDFQKFYEINQCQSFSINNNTEKVNLNGNQMIDNLYDSVWIPKNVVVWNKLFKRNIFSLIRFPKGLVHEDEYIFIDLYKSNPNIVYSTEKLYYYRIRENSITSDSNSIKNNTFYLEVINNRLNYFFARNKNLFEITKDIQIRRIIKAIFAGDVKSIPYLNNYEIVSKILLNSKIYWKTKLLLIFRLICLCFR